MSLTIWPVVILSLKVALLATFLVMLTSVILALIFVEKSSLIIKACEFLIYLPMALPPVALGYGLLLALGPHSLLGQFFHNYLSLDIAFTFLGAVIASYAVSLCIGVRTVKVCLEQIDPNQAQIARLLGATYAQVLRHIVLPQCRSAIVGGSILVFIRSLAEFGATMVLAGNSLETRTLALAIWIAMETPGQERQCLILVLLAIFISLIALISMEFVLRRR